jgi:hypothetical protein
MIAKSLKTVTLLHKVGTERLVERGDIEDVIRVVQGEVTPRQERLMAFDQLLVEGFQLKPLRNLLETWGRKADASWASLRVIAEILVASGKTVDDAKACLTPLSRLHALRSTLKAHSSVEARNGESSTLVRHMGP